MELIFDDFLTRRGGGAWVILYAPDGTVISLSFKLEIPYSNNEVEFEYLVIGFISALHMGNRELQMQGDSKIIMKQVNHNHA